MWLALMLTLHATADEGDYYLETAPGAERAPADEALKVAAAAGCRGRVIRKYVVGQGWRYLFRSEPFVSPDGGSPCLEVQWPDGMTAVVMHESEGVVRAADGGEADSSAPAPKQDWSAPEVLRRVARAHGGPHTVSGPPDLQVFRFRRTTTDGRVIDHVFATRGEDVFVEIQVIEGAGTPTRFGVVSGKPWMSPKPDDVLDEELVREQALRFSPERVLGVPYRFTRGVPEDREYAAMRMESPILVGQRPMQRLLFDGDRSRKPFMLGVDVGTWQIQQVAVGRGAAATTFEMSDYREIDGGMVYPSSVVVRRDGVVLDRVVVQELDFSPTLPEEWFRKGGP